VLFVVPRFVEVPPAIVVKVRDGQVRNTPFYVVMGVTTNGEREILGI
jgi:putative transposase